MADITPIASLNGEISPIASLTGELAMPEKVWMQGPPGPQGPKGDKGDTGPAGAGVPDGGTVGQLLSKTESGTAWIDPPQSGGGVPTLHINVTSVNTETLEPTFTADKTPAEMRQAAINGPIWCVVTFAAGVMSEEALSLGVPPSMGPINTVAFGSLTLPVHDKNFENDVIFVVSGTPNNVWSINLTAFAGN